ncbi:MAG: hypothetical protein HXX08_21100 [Chloroflexi bacterium]|uniref:Uncharacterized protein n=1 Tax=Candidatus Chlorohelix allophototropha TaxID=3003348 RepID=A0A8T7M8T1_9CHLR|nr:hypothetical protein [Chloroflexota bacterium]WJW68296.1 hypothetical protein OZ401_003904 [Chloroflexota bacterium L227-S17]
MAIVILHVLNQDAIVGEMEKLPDPKDSFVSISNPRKMDNRPVTFIDKRARVIMFPWNQIFFIEVMESEEEKRDTLNIWRE